MKTCGLLCLTGIDIEWRDFPIAEWYCWVPSYYVVSTSQLPQSGADFVALARYTDVLTLFSIFSFSSSFVISPFICFLKFGTSRKKNLESWPRQASNISLKCSTALENMSSRSWNCLHVASNFKIATYITDHIRPYWIWQPCRGYVFHMDELFLNNCSNVFSTNRLCNTKCGGLLSLSCPFLPPSILTINKIIVATVAVEWILWNNNNKSVSDSMVLLGMGKWKGVK